MISTSLFNTYIQLSLTELRTELAQLESEGCTNENVLQWLADSIFAMETAS